MKSKSIKTSLLALAIGACSCIGLGALSIKKVVPVAAETAQEFFMTYGAATRLADDFYGLRFKMAVTPAYYEAHTDADGNYGMLIIPYDYLTTYADAIEENGNNYVKAFQSEDVEVLNFADMQGYAADADYQPTMDTEEVSYQCFNGVISTIKYDNLERDFIAIGYYYDGTTYEYAAFNQEDNARNVVEVAGNALVENAVAETDLYTTDHVLRLYEYEFLNEQRNAGVSEADANTAYADYQETLLPQYVSTKEQRMTLGQKTNIDKMNSGDVLTLEFDILESDLGTTVKTTGLAIGPNVFGHDAPYVNTAYAASLFTTYLTNFNDGTIRLYSVDTAQYTGTRHDTSYMGLNSLQGGKSVKYEYRPYISESEKGSVTVYWKDVEDTEWTKAGSVTDIDESYAPNTNVGIAFTVLGMNSCVVDNFNMTYNGESIETATKNVDVRKGNIVTVESDGVEIDTAFVPVGKAYTPDESLGIEEWTVNGESYDISSPIMTSITLEGYVPVPVSYDISINTTVADHICFSNNVALEKGRDITFEYTVKSVVYNTAITNGLHALGSYSTTALAYGNIANSKYDLVASYGAASLNARVLPEGTDQSLRVKIVFTYDETTEKYNWAIYQNDVLNLDGSTIANSAIAYNEYFGMAFVRFLVSIELESVKCYDSEGTNLGVTACAVYDANNVVTLTANMEDDTTVESDPEESEPEDSTTEESTPVSYDISINTTVADHICFSNNVALEKGRDITFEYTVKSVVYNTAITNGLHALGSYSTTALAYGNIANSKYDLVASYGAASLNARVLPEGTDQSLRVKIVFTYDETTEKYNWAIYQNDVLNLDGSTIANSAIAYNEYFGMALVRFLVSIELEDVKCYDSEGANLGVTACAVYDANNVVTVTPNTDE